jgi:hypothetical protein
VVTPAIPAPRPITSNRTRGRRTPSRREHHRPPETSQNNQTGAQQTIAPDSQKTAQIGGYRKTAGTDDCHVTACPAYGRPDRRLGTAGQPIVRPGPSAQISELWGWPPPLGQQSTGFGRAVTGSNGPPGNVRCGGRRTSRQVGMSFHWHARSRSLAGTSPDSAHAVESPGLVLGYPGPAARANAG